MAFMPLLQGCFKDVVEYTDFRISVYDQTESNGEFVRSTDLETYAFYVDTTEWTVKSYEDALARRITNKTTGKTQTEPDAIGEFYADDEYQVTIRLESEMSMIVVVNPTLKLFAYRNYKLPINLPAVDTKLYMASWRPSHSVAGWRVVNNFYEPPTEEPTPPADDDEPTVPPTDDDEPTTPPADDGEGGNEGEGDNNEGNGNEDNGNNDDNNEGEGKGDGEDGGRRGQKPRDQMPAAGQSVPEYRRRHAAADHGADCAGSRCTGQAAVRKQLNASQAGLYTQSVSDVRQEGASPVQDGDHL